MRSELISMNGATIIDFDGNIISIGAIIQNDSAHMAMGEGLQQTNYPNLDLP